MGRYISPPTTAIIDQATGESVHVEHESLSVIEHTHEDQSAIHFDVDLAAGTTRYILIDLSDTTNWPHDNATVIHIDWVDIHIDSDNTGDYVIKLIALANVDATNGDAYVIHETSGSKTAGNNIDEEMNLTPNGWLVDSARIGSSDISLNDVTYQTDVNLYTLFDPATSDTPPGSGDLILEAVVNAGNITINYDIGYHTHAAGHP